jgi:acyl dehydratase
MKRVGGAHSSAPSEGRAILRPVSGEPVVYFEDMKLGDEYTSPGRTVTEADIVIFAGLSGDYNVLHTDAEHMKASQFGERIAHGLLGLSIQQGLLDRVVPGQAVGPLSAVKWKFKGPIKIGDTIHVQARVSAKKDGEQPGAGVVTVERRVVNQRGEVVQEGEHSLMIWRRPR